MSEYYTVVSDEDGHDYLVPESKLAEVVNYFETFYRLLHGDEENQDRAYKLMEPINLDKARIDGGRLWFKEPVIK
jgi:hypothetical protein